MDADSCIKIKKQYNRINGQVLAIGKMIDNERDYLEILQQITAARNALSSLGVELLKNESNSCFEKNDNGDKINTDPEIRIKKFEKLVTKFFKLT